MTELFATLQAEHDSVWELTNALTGGAGDDPPAPAARGHLARELVRLLSGHELAEELVVWPAVRRECPEGNQLAEVALRQEHDLKLTLNELSSISPSQEFDECVNTIAGELRAHLSYEQVQVWPRLADCLTDAQAGQLLAAWQEARSSSAAKPHPHLPPDPRVLGALMPALRLADRMVESLRGRVSLPGA